MASGEPDPTLEDLSAWALARALPEVEDEGSEGYEALRRKLLDWIEERRRTDTRDAGQAGP